MKPVGKYTDGKISKSEIVYVRLFKQGLAFYSDETMQDLKDRWLFQDIKVNHDWADGIGGSFEHKDRYGATFSTENYRLFSRIKDQLKSNDRATFLISAKWSTLFALAFVSAAVMWYGFPLFGKLIEQTAYLVPQSAQKKLGDYAVEMIGEHFTPCEDDEARKYVQIIVDDLVSHQDNKELKPEIHLFKTTTANAFALPGQNMGVLSGFLARAKNEEEIAGVLAHEIGHIAKKDALKYIIRSEGFKAIASMGSTNVYGDIASTAATFSTLQYSRDQESAADLYAQSLLNKAGYSTKGLETFLLTLSASQPATFRKLEKTLSFLSTHPDTESRINVLRKTNQVDVGKKKLLSEEQFKRLQNACRQKSAASEKENKNRN